MKNNTLYELQGEVLALYELLGESGGEVTEETEAAFDGFFRETDEKVEQKLNRYGFVMRNFQAEAMAIQAEAERLMERAKRKQKAYDALKRRVHEFLKTTDTQKIETTNFTFRRQKNGGKAPVILDEFYQKNPVELPERYRVVEFKPNLEQIRVGLENPDSGEEIDFARIGERGEHLRID